MTAKLIHVGDTIRFRIGGRSVAGKVQEDRGPIGLNGRRLYGVRYELGEGNWYTTELPADQIEVIEPENESA